MGILPSLRSYAKWFHSYIHMKMTGEEIYILNLRHTMSNVHKVTFRYIIIISQFNSLYMFQHSYQVIWSLVVNYEVMDLQKWDKCNRGYFLHTKFAMWEQQ